MAMAFNHSVKAKPWPRFYSPVLWKPPELTVADLDAWLKENKVSRAVLARGLNVDIQTVDKILRMEPSETLAQNFVLALTSLVMFSGLPGIFEIKTVEISQVHALIRGLKAAIVPKNDRNLSQVNALGYAIQVANTIDRKGIPRDVFDEVRRNPRSSEADQTKDLGGEQSG